MTFNELASIKSYLAVAVMKSEREIVSELDSGIVSGGG